MAVALSELVNRLQSAVPPRNDVPSATDYEQHVMDAVLQLAQDVPRLKRAELAVASGTATYDLPDDFLFLIELPSLCHADGVLVSSGGLVPVPTTWQERYEVVDRQITFYPTPTYTLPRSLRYAAGYILTGDSGNEQYASLTQNGARIALLYAQYLALTQQANPASGDGWRYQIGDEMVDKSNQGKNLMGQAERVLGEYRRAVQAQKGYGSRGETHATLKTP